MVCVHRILWETRGEIRLRDAGECSNMCERGLMVSRNVV